MTWFWFTSHSRLVYEWWRFFRFPCPLVNTPQLNTQLSYWNKLSYECRMTADLWMNAFLRVPSLYLREGPNISHHLQQFLRYYVFSDPLPSSGRPSTVQSVTSGTCLSSHCVTMVIRVTVFIVTTWLMMALFETRSSVENETILTP
jgi:hypothetical protein